MFSFRQKSYRKYDKLLEQTTAAVDAMIYKTKTVLCTDMPK